MNLINMLTHVFSRLTKATKKINKPAVQRCLPVSGKFCKIHLKQTVPDHQYKCQEHVNVKPQKSM